MKDLADFKATYVTLIEADKAAADVHPDLDELIAHHRGELASAEAERLRDHLRQCRQCADAIGELEAFDRAAREPEPVDFETAASWRALRPRLDETRRWPFPPALAAMLLLAVVGSGAWLLFQQRTSGHRQPRPNPVIVDLVAEASWRAAEAYQEIIVPDSGAVLVLTPDAVPEAPDYEIRIFAADDSLVRTVTGLELQPVSETFTLFLPADSLARGDYRLELYGSDPDEPIAGGYRIRWRRASRP